MNRRTLVSMLIWAFVLCSPAWAQTIYQVDDGTLDNAIGIGNSDADLWWANAFTAQPGADSIEEIQIAFRSGTVNAGQAFSVHVYDDSDNDGDPTTGTLTLLASANATVADADNETFQSIPIGPVTVSGGFFVAAVMAGQNGQYPAALDTTNPQGQSWFGATAPSGLDPADPIGTATTITVQTIDNLGFPGNFPIRAVAAGPTATPGIPVLGTAGTGVLIVLLASGALAILRRRAG